MRENNHIIMRSSYQDMSSFKIRQPMAEQSFHGRQNIPQKYGSREYEFKAHMNSRDHKVMSSSSSFYQKPHYRQYEQKENSRQLSYNSRGSNQTKNSIKMSDYIAQQAKNLINNKDKFKYENQSHMRSSSVHCYPSSLKITRGNNEKSFNYLNAKQMSNQLTEIPSFGVQCRTTVSGGYNAPETKSHSLSKYPTNSFKLSDPSASYRLQNRNIKTEIDERIQRLKTSSTSVQHKERLSKIKKIDQHKLENMDKINIKIKNILTTLQNEQDHYKRRFNDGSNRIKTESSAFYDHRSRQIQQQQEESLLSKYTKNNDYSQSRFSRLDFSQQDTFFNNSYSNIYQQEDSVILDNNNNNNNKTALGKYCENNASSYYYYEDEEAMIKSSESPFKSSPDRSFKKRSVQKEGCKSVSKYSKSAYNVANFKATNFNESIKPGRQVNSSSYSQSKYPKNNSHVLTNIPECETEIIESKAIELSNNNGFAEAYQTFDTRKSSVINKNQKNQSIYRESHIQREPQTDKNPYSYKFQKSSETYFPSSKNKFNAKETQTQRFINTQNLKDELNKQSENQIAQKKTNLIYFKQKDNDKYLQSSNKNHSKSFGFDYRNQEFVRNQVSEFNQQVSESKYRENTNDQYRAHKNPTYLSSYNPPDHTHEMTFDHKKKNYIYSDSIKQTPRIQQVRSNQNHKKFSQSNIKYTRSNNLKTQQNENKLDEKFKQYEQKLEKYQKGMSASKILESQRSENRSLNTKRDRSQSIYNSQDKNLNLNTFFVKDSNFKPGETVSNFQTNDLVTSSEQNMEKLLLEIRKERYGRQLQKREESYKAQKNLQQNSSSKNYQANQFKRNEVEKYCRLVSTPPNHSKRESHRFPKQDHEKFIENLRRDREEVAQLSQRKSRLNNCVSVENDPIQASNQRSESQNSKLSSNTIVKGKNIDEEISKIQRKMQEYNQMKKELNLDSKLNTQRTQNQHTQVKQFEFEREPKKVQFEPKDRFSYSESKQRSFKLSSQKKSQDLLKIVAQENTFVKVRNSVLKDHRTNEIKNYLDDEIQRESNRSKSIDEKNEVSLGKSRHNLSKQNMPPTTTTIDSPKYPNGNRKVVLGLAQNLVLNQIDDNFQNKEQIVAKNEIKTPKLLRNLKNKLNEKCIVKKKAQKRGFRCQFINDLHEDNQIIASAKKIQQSSSQDEDAIESTSRYSPQNKETLMKILDLIEKQILIDQKFRNQKKMFNAMTKSDKWNILMSEYIRQNPSEKRILLGEIVDMFTLSEEQSNPFYSTRGVDFSLQAMVRTYGECRDSWNLLIKQISFFSYDQVISCGINAKNLDIQRKGFIEADDLTRFINMQLNKYYRKRDLWLIWERLASANNLRKQLNLEHKLFFNQFCKGLQLVKRENY